jgi:hypothetical protein
MTILRNWSLLQQVSERYGS